MESNVRPLLYYLIKNRRGALAILAATDMQAKELYSEGVPWLGVPFKTRAEAEAALEDLKSN
jgi:hypothetical protein